MSRKGGTRGDMWELLKCDMHNAAAGLGCRKELVGERVSQFFLFIELAYKTLLSLVKASFLPLKVV